VYPGASRNLLRFWHLRARFRFFAVSSGRHPHSQSSDGSALSSRAHDPYSSNPAPDRAAGRTAASPEPRRSTSYSNKRYYGEAPVGLWRCERAVGDSTPFYILPSPFCIRPQPPFSISHSYPARSIRRRVGYVLPAPTVYSRRHHGDTTACTGCGSHNPLYLQGIPTTFCIERALRCLRCQVRCWRLNSPRCRLGPSETAGGVGGGMSSASLGPDFGL